VSSGLPFLRREAGLLEGVPGTVVTWSRGHGMLRHGLMDGGTRRPTRAEEDHPMHPQAFQPLDSAVIPRFAEPATFMRTPYVHTYPAGGVPPSNG
jgi:hypothetical protein